MFLAAHSVVMVTYCVTKIISICPVIRQFIMAHQNLRLGKSWKLFWATLSSSPCKKEATKWQKLAPFCIPCTTLLLFYHTSDWLNQQNLPKLQVAAYLFIINWSTIFISAKSLLILNTTVILCGEHWKIGGFYCLCLRLLWLVEMFTHKENYLSE